MDAFAWREAEVNELNLLPFGLDEALLPGETKQVRGLGFSQMGARASHLRRNTMPSRACAAQVHLFEARFLELFVEAEAKHKGCVGQMLVLPSNGVASVTSLLEIEESRRQEFGVWARLRCVGRVRLKEAEATDFGFVRAQVDPQVQHQRAVS